MHDKTGSSNGKFPWNLTQYFEIFMDLPIHPQLSSTLFNPFFASYSIDIAIICFVFVDIHCLFVSSLFPLPPYSSFTIPSSFLLIVIVIAFDALYLFYFFFVLYINEYNVKFLLWMK